MNSTGKSLWKTVTACVAAAVAIAAAVYFGARLLRRFLKLKDRPYDSPDLLSQEEYVEPSVQVCRAKEEDAPVPRTAHEDLAEEVEKAPTETAEPVPAFPE